MPLSIRNPQAERLARQVAAETGENLTQAIMRSLEERLDRLRGRRTAGTVVDEIMTISRNCSALPDLDSRSVDEILEYDKNGGLV